MKFATLVTRRRGNYTLAPLKPRPGIARNRGETGRKGEDFRKHKATWTEVDYQVLSSPSSLEVHMSKKHIQYHSMPLAPSFSMLLPRSSRVGISSKDSQLKSRNKHSNHLNIKTPRNSMRNYMRCEVFEKECKHTVDGKKLQWGTIGYL